MFVTESPFPLRDHAAQLCRPTHRHLDLCRSTQHRLQPFRVTKLLPCGGHVNAFTGRQMALRDVGARHGEALTCGFRKEVRHVPICLQPVATPARRRQVGPLVKAAFRKRTDVVHLRYNLFAERLVTVGTGPHLQLFPPSQNVTTGWVERRLGRAKGRRDVHGTSHRPDDRGAYSRHRPANCGHSSRRRECETNGRHAASPTLAYHSSSRARRAWSIFPSGVFM